MAMGIEKAYATLKDNPPMTQKVSSNPASPFQGIAMLAQQYQNQTNKKEIPVPMQSVLQQQQAQAQQPTTFAKGDKVKSKAKSPDHAIDLQIAKQFGTNIPPKLKAILKAGAAHTIATGKPDPGHLRAVLREASKLPPEIQAKFAPQFAAAKAALAKATGVAGISKFAEGDVVNPTMREVINKISREYPSEGISPEPAPELPEPELPELTDAQLDARINKQLAASDALLQNTDNVMKGIFGNDVYGSRKYKGGIVSKFAEGDTVEAEEDFTDSPGKYRRDIEELASMYAKPSLSPEMAQMMQMAQEGKQRQGLASVIGAALTGAATPHALQAGQNSAMMAGEAADKGIASLQAGQDAMMGKAAEIEGGEAAAHNQALAALLASQMEDKKYKAALASAGLRGSNSLQVAREKIIAANEGREDTQKFNESMLGKKHLNAKEIQNANIVAKKTLFDLHEATLAEIEKGKNDRTKTMTSPQVAANALDQVKMDLDAWKENPLNTIHTYPTQEAYQAYLKGEPFDVETYFKNKKPAPAPTE